MLCSNHVSFPILYIYICTSLGTAIFVIRSSVHCSLFVVVKSVLVWCGEGRQKGSKHTHSKKKRESKSVIETIIIIIKRFVLPPFPSFLSCLSCVNMMTSEKKEEKERKSKIWAQEMKIFYIFYMCLSVFVVTVSLSCVCVCVSIEQTFFCLQTFWNIRYHLVITHITVLIIQIHEASPHFKTKSSKYDETKEWAHKKLLISMIQLE